MLLAATTIHDTDESTSREHTQKEQGMSMEMMEEQVYQETYQTNLQLAALANLCDSHKQPSSPPPRKRRQQQQQGQGNTSHRPTHSSVPSVSSPSSSSSVGYALQALQLLRSMKRPDTVAYNSVLKAFAKLSPLRVPKTETDNASIPNDDSENDKMTQKHRHKTRKPEEWSAAEQAWSLLQEMKDVYTQQSNANQQWYTKLKAHQLSDQEVSQGPPRVTIKPNVRSYATVMDAHARMGTMASAKHVQALLEELQDRYEQSGHDAALLPNLICYNCCLSALAKAGLFQECYQLYQDMPLPPDTISANTVLHAIVKSNNPDTTTMSTGERAEQLLRKMQKDGIMVNARSYTTCMDAWSRCGRPDKAQALLDELLSKYDDDTSSNDNDDRYQPNCVTYSTMIHAYAISRDSQKAMKAYQLFLDMKRRNIRPNKIVLHNLLNCCATSTPSPETIHLVEQIYKQIVRQGHPDHVTFGTVLKAASHLVWKDRDFCSNVFRQACDCGQVSAGVLRQFRQAVPMDTYRRLVGTERVDIQDVPLEWKRNVPTERSTKRRKY